MSLAWWSHLDGKCNLEGQKLLELLEALSRRFLVGVGDLQLCADRGIFVTGTEVVLLNGVVGGLEQFVLRWPMETGSLSMSMPPR